jgi:hypothetical protein
MGFAGCCTHSRAGTLSCAALEATPRAILDAATPNVPSEGRRQQMQDVRMYRVLGRCHAECLG